MMVVPMASQGELREAVARTSDAALLDVVRLLDSLAYRPGELSQVLTGALPRLRLLRPARPLRFPRLLFTPLEGAIVAGEAWRAGDATLPRAALTPIAEAVHAALGRLAEAIDAELMRRNPDHVDQVGPLGVTLWAAAAATAPRLGAGASMSPGDLQACLSLCTGVWRHAEALWPVLRHLPACPPDEPLQHLLERVAGDSVPRSIILATLLHRAERPGTLAARAREMRPGDGATIEQALDRWIERSVAACDVATPALATQAASRFEAVTRDLEAAGWLDSRARRIRVDHVRQGIERAHDGQDALAADIVTEARGALGLIRAIRRRRLLNTARSAPDRRIASGAPEKRED